MVETRQLTRILGIIATIILVVSFSAFAYTLVPKGNPELVTVNGAEYDWDSIFTEFDIHTFTALEEERFGISLEDLVLDSGVQNPEAKTYRLNGLDGYQKDISWNDIQNGYLTEDLHRAVFPELTQSFWVRDLASIEVI